MSENVSLYEPRASTVFYANCLVLILSLGAIIGLKPDVRRMVFVAWSSVPGFFMLWQTQRSLRRYAAKRPWLEVLAFGALYVAMSRWGYPVFFAWMRGFTESGRMDASTALYVFQILHALLAWVVFPLGCSLMAILAGGRADNEGVPSGSFAGCFLQALTVVGGIFVPLNIVISQSELYWFDLVRELFGPIDTTLLAGLLAIHMSLVMGFSVYGCWPQVLKTASGVFLFFLGCLIALVGVLPAALLGMWINSAHAPLLWLLAVPVCLIGMAGVATCVGLLARSLCGREERRR